MRGHDRQRIRAVLVHLAFSYGIEVESYRDTAVGMLSGLSPQVF